MKAFFCPGSGCFCSVTGEGANSLKLAGIKHVAISCVFAESCVISSCPCPCLVAESSHFVIVSAVS